MRGLSRMPQARTAYRQGLVALVLAAAAGLSGCGASLSNDPTSASIGGQTPPAVLGASTGMTGTAQAAGDTAIGESSDKSTFTANASAVENFTAVSTPGNTAYKIGPQDVLDISVFKVPELSKSVQVADSGTINLPLVGEVPAAGKTAQEVERELTKKLGAKYLQSPQVTVFVKEYNSQRVTIEGAVKKPGVYPVRGKTSLLQFIALAEGLDPAAQDEIVVFRQADGKRIAGKFDIEEIRAGRLADPLIREGDVIVVGSSGMKAAWQNFLKAVPAAAQMALFF